MKKLCRYNNTIHLCLYIITINIFSINVAFAVAPVPALHASISSRLQHDLDNRMARGDTTPATVIFESLDNEDLLPFIKSEKLSMRHHADSRYEISIAPQNAKNILNKLSGNVWVRESYPHVPSAVTQGVVISGADDFHQLLINGADVKIGVIDLQFSNYSTSQANGELPVNLVITDYTGTGLAGGTHGTNVAEIVHDMAPGASLYLAKVNTDVQLTQATNDMIAAGVKVIVHSVAWFGSSFYDGTGVLCNTTNAAESNGILWLNAAGNQRNMHYLGTMTDTNGDKRHEFAVGQDYNTITASAGQVVTLILNWDAYPKTKVDYNLYLYNGIPSAGGALVASSTNLQNSGSGNVPYEAISYTVPVTGTYYVVVQKQQTSTASLAFALFSLAHDFSIRTNASSLAQPADCASTMAVAATNLTDGVEYFSAEGPRWREGGVLKPEISAPDRVITSLTASFAGTSAAAPHVAGVAALLFQNSPSATVASVRQSLINSAHDVSTTGFDYRTGYGRISMDADGDGWNADLDNCPLVVNAGQEDFDGDGIGDTCDQCPSVSNDDVSDIDSDGLTAFQECISGTDSANPDSDGDGLLDGNEVNVYLTNPLLVDSDGDTFNDYLEVQLGTNPNLATNYPIARNGDINGDGLVDVRDMLLAQQVLNGSRTLTLSELLRADVAPLVNDVPSPDGEFNPGDLLVITRKALGLVQY